jgi:hypothetical protein
MTHTADAEIEKHWRRDQLALCREILRHLGEGEWTWGGHVNEGKTVVLASSTRSYDLRIHPPKSQGGRPPPPPSHTARQASPNSSDPHYFPAATGRSPRC